jgi:hypothetical protein
MVISEIDHLSSMTATFTFLEIALVIDTRLLHVGICILNGHFCHWTDISVLHINIVTGVNSSYSNINLEYVALFATYTVWKKMQS